MIDNETGDRLAHAGHGEEHRRQCADLRVTQTEFRDQPRKQRRNHQMEKVRDAMTEPNQGNGFDLAPSGIDRGDAHG